MGADIDFYNEIEFVSDTPSETDQFATKSHERVAKTLVQIIANGDGGRAIGLEGTWGSGKSTVIDFALTEFQKWNQTHVDKHTVFVFDAWAHQGDPLRRVFLEELIQALATRHVVDEDKWKEALDRLQSKRKKTIETKAEKLGWVAWVALLALPLYPGAYALIAAMAVTATETFKVPVLGTFSRTSLFVTGLLIVIAPYVFAGLTKLFWLRDPDKKGKSVILLFNKQTDHVTTEQLIREDEATSVEFNLQFDLLVKDAKSNGHRLIIVLDNLDRLANDNIREIWATMRNFFAATPGSSRQETLRNVWLIVPIDRQHIEAVFADKEHSLETQTTRGFVEKTFEIVLRVPPPLLSNWRKFFESTLRNSFKTKISDNDIYRVFRLFEIYQTVHPTIVTPRAIKAFINKVVAQAKLSGNLIPLEYQCLFVLYKDKIALSLKPLQDSTLLDAAVQATITDPDWTKYLAAAHFNAPPDDALEILLGPEIEKALLGKDSARLDGLKKTGGFDSILHDMIASKAASWALENATNYFDIAATLNTVDLADKAVLRLLWSDFEWGATSLNKPIVPNDSTLIGLKSVLARSGGSERVLSAIKSCLLSPRTEFPEGADQAGYHWAQLVEVFVQSLTDLVGTDRAVELEKSFKVNGDVQYFLGAIEAIADSKTIKLSNFSSAHTKQQITEAISAIIQTEQPTFALQKIIDVLRTKTDLLDWGETVTAIQNRLTSNSPANNAASAYEFVTILRGLSEFKPAIESLSQMGADGTLHGILELGRKEKHTDLVTAIIAQLIASRNQSLPGPAEHPQYGQLGQTNQFLTELQSKPTDVDLLEKITTITSQAGQFPQILKLALPTEENRNIFRELVRRMIESPIAKQFIVPDLVTNFSRVDEIVGEASRNKLLRKIDEIDIAAELDGEKWKTIQPLFLEVSKKSWTRHYRAILDAVQNGLATLSVDDWGKSLKDEDNVLALVFALLEIDETKTLDTSFFDALKGHVESIIEGAAAPSEFGARWHELPQMLSRAQREPFYKFIRDQLINKTPKPETIVKVFDLFGEKFAKDADLPERSDAVIRTIIEPLLAGGVASNLACVENYASVFASTIRRAESVDKEFITERVNSLYAGTAEAGRNQIADIAKSLRIKITAPLQREPDEPPKAG